MKNLLSILLFFSLVSKLNAQSSDSLIVIQVDSLINESRSLTNDREFEKASEINHIAEMLTVENLGKESATYGNVCFNKGRILYFQTNYVEAEKWYLLSMNVRDKSLGKKHVDYAWSLNNLAILYFEVGQLKKAEKLYLEALEIRKNALGKEHPQYASSLNNLGNLYVETGHYNKAELLLIEALTIRKKVLGVEHVDYGSSIYNLGRLYRIMGKYEKAEPLSIEEKIISEKLRGKEHPDYASTLLNLGILYIEMGKYKQAESLYLEAKTIQEKIFGKEHPDYASTLNNLAILYFDMNQYELAEPLYIESKDIRMKIFGEEHPDYATSLDNLARFYYNLGEYGKAEPLHLEAKAIRERVLGKDHPDYASGLNNLAILYIELGQFEKAESLYLEAKLNWEKSLGNVNPKYANILNNLADLYVMTQNYSKAEHFMLEAITITEKLLGKEHPDYARDLNNLGIVYLKTGAYKKAEPLFSEAKTVLEKSVGKLHSTYAATLNNLADFYQITKNYKKAEILYLQIKEINKLILGKEHPYYSINLNNLAKLYEIQGRFSESENHLNEYFAITNSNLAKSVAFLSEKELAKYVIVNTDGGLVSSFLLSREYKNIPSGILPAINFNQALFQKGFLLSSVSRLNRLISYSTEAALTNKLLKAYRFRLAKEYAVPIAARDTLVLVDLEEKTNIAEKKLARIVAGYSEANRQYTWRKVQAALAKSTNGKMGVAAIEFVHFKLNFPKTSDSIYYAALLLTPGLSQVKFIPLFEGKVLDSILKQEKNIFLKTNALYASRGVNPIYKNNVLSKNLYSLIWKPIEKELKNISTVYFSASGSLNQLNLGAIPVDEKEVLFDKYNLIQLNSTRQLVDSQEISFNNQTAVLFGGIQYEMDSNAINLAILHLKKDVTTTSSGLVSFIQTDSTLRGGIWGYLPGTENEISVLEKSLQFNGIVTETYRNYAATEEAFKCFGIDNTESPRILHIATHGYFFPDQKINSQQSAVNNQSESVFKMSDHPMLRSGLILAGGNAAWQGKTSAGREDGILTAYEISQMNLSNTELVVLSACETGLGDIQGNEGVYGLQRAFKIAGAKYLIMSLWQVPDKQTSLLMTTFYKKWLENKMTIPDAFHAAQKELRDLGLEPYQWAGFVLVE